MESESDGHLPYLDIDIYRRLDSFLGHTIYRKLTHTDLSLNAKSHHHSVKKHTVLVTLAHRATAICDQDSLPGELDFLCSKFKLNGLKWQIHQAP